MIGRALPFLFALTLLGCASSKPAESAAKGQVADGKYVSAKGKLLCPVMDVEIESEAKAAGRFQHDGVTYFVCCEPCIKQFKENPTAFAVKR